MPQPCSPQPLVRSCCHSVSDDPVVCTSIVCEPQCDVIESCSFVTLSDLRGCWVGVRRPWRGHSSYCRAADGKQALLRELCPQPLLQGPDLRHVCRVALVHTHVTPELFPLHSFTWRHSFTRLQAGLEPAVLLSRPLECWGVGNAVLSLPHLAEVERVGS